MEYGPATPADSEQEKQRRHESNRRAWNEGAQFYTAGNAERLEALGNQQSNLHPIERQNLLRYGDFSSWCHRAIHLQCASGEDTLSLLIEGAQEVVGIDFSENMIQNAQATTKELGWNATWHCCDVVQAPEALNGTADLLYTGRGAICWLMDIDAWAQTVQRLMKPGGVLSLLEDHPAAFMFHPESEKLEVDPEISFFNYWETSKGWPESYIGDGTGIPAVKQAAKFERFWTISEVITALLKAGLRLVHFGEHNTTYWDSFPKLSPDERTRIPLSYSLLAEKPR